ncbi:MAG: RNase adapter RapZ [Pseudomonadota bacterium]
MLVIITGLSGSGKSTAANTLEDMGYFCVDNIPVDLLPKLLELTDMRGGGLIKLALVIDLRQRDFLPRYSAVLGELKLGGTEMEVLFLDARDDVIVRRYSETRRRHPMALTGSVSDGLRREREALGEIREKADWVLDTSDLTVHQLREEIRKIFARSGTDDIKVVVNSFGFGKGLPLESDLVLDVRFLPNPYFEQGLREKTGLDPEVNEWIRTKATTKAFLEKLEDILVFLLPLYIKEGKRYLTISVGCTGGRHRSVAIAEFVRGLLVDRGFGEVEVRHRELQRSLSPARAG